MINEITIKKLNQMRLPAMAERYRIQQGDQSFDSLSFEERFGLLVDFEWDRRKSNKLTRLIKNASFKFNQACVEDIEYHSDRKLDESLMMKLTTCKYISDKNNLIIMGAAGNGKSYIACALGIEACRKEYTVKYTRLQELLDELIIAKGEGIFKKVMKKYKNIDLLIIDEWLLTSLKSNEARELFEIIESRYQEKSTVYCSQFAPEGWHEKIGEITLADAILDRIVHASYKVFIDGKTSMRERNGLNT
jgi:DNA replication protein DnaC